MRDEIRLLIPAMPAFVRLARLTAAGLASRLGFTFEQVEDLRIAVDELCHCLMGTRGVRGVVVLTCAVSDDALAIEGTLVGLKSRELTPLPAGVSTLSPRILSVVVDEYELQTDGQRRCSMVKKRHSLG